MLRNKDELRRSGNIALLGWSRTGDFDKLIAGPTLGYAQRSRDRQHGGFRRCAGSRDRKLDNCNITVARRCDGPVIPAREHLWSKVMRGWNSAVYLFISFFAFVAV